MAADWLGETLAKLELLPNLPAVPAPDEWLASWFTEVANPDQWADIALRARRARADWADVLGRSLASITELSELVGHPSPQRLTVSHTDLQPKNVLITSAGFALLDWDDVAQVSRDRVLARALIDWHVHGTHVDGAAMRRTLASYRRGGGAGVVSELGDFGDVAAGFLNYLYEQAQTGADASRGDADAAAASERVAAMLQHPLDMAILNRVLATVRDL